MEIIRNKQISAVVRKGELVIIRNKIVSSAVGKGQPGGINLQRPRGRIKEMLATFLKGDPSFMVYFQRCLEMEVAEGQLGDLLPSFLSHVC